MMTVSSGSKIESEVVGTLSVTLLLPFTKVRVPLASV